MEQKNWPHVRKLVGWDRYDTPQAQDALYAELRLFQNLFQSSMKLLRKERRGSQLLRRYDAPQTPFARVRASAATNAVKMAALERLFRRTDPFALAQRIGQYLERLGYPAESDHTPLPLVQAYGGAAGPSVHEPPRHRFCPTEIRHTQMAQEPRSAR